MKALRLSDIRIDAKLTPQCAELTLRLRDEAIVEGDVQWSGRVRGPFCVRRQTLAANYSIRTAKELVAGIVTIPDFCHWSSEGPFTYQLEIELKRAGEVIGSLRDTLAVNWVTVHQGRIFQAGKRWVPRMARIRIARHETEQGLEDLRILLEAVRSNDLVLVIGSGEDTDTLLRECLSGGVSVAIETSEVDVAALARWESFACVILILHMGEHLTDMATSLLVAEREKEGASIDATTWRIFRGGSRTEAVLIARDATHDAPEAARCACDRLQADAAVLGDWAGYLA